MVFLFICNPWHSLIDPIPAYAGMTKEVRAFARSAFLFTWTPWSSHGVTKGTKWIITHSLTTPSQPPTRHVARGPGAVGIGCWLLVIYHPVTLTRATPPQRGTLFRDGMSRIPLRWGTYLVTGMYECPPPLAGGGGRKTVGGWYE